MKSENSRRDIGTLKLAHLFVKVYRPGDSEETFRFSSQAAIVC